MLVLAMEFSRCGCRHSRRRRATAQPPSRRGGRRDSHARALRPKPQRVVGEVAPSKRNRRSRTSSWRTVGGGHLRRPCGPEVRIASGQLGAPWRKPARKVPAPGKAP